MTLYWIDQPTNGRLAIMARPRAGDWLSDEIDRWRDAAVNTVVSVLEAAEIVELGLQAEARLCLERGLTFISFPIEDRHVPDSPDRFRALADNLGENLAEGQSIAIHCRAGIGRSALLAACVLVGVGVSPGAALTAISRARRVEVPDTNEQRAWVFAFADEGV